MCYTFHVLSDCTIASAVVKRIFVIIYAISLQRLSGFYQEALGMALDDHDADYHRLLSSDSDYPAAELVRLQTPAQIVASVTIETPPVVRASTPIKPVFHLADSIAQIRARVEASGGLFSPAGDEWDFRDDRVCDGVDLEGNVFQVRSPALAV